MESNYTWWIGTQCSSQNVESSGYEVLEFLIRLEKWLFTDKKGGGGVGGQSKFWRCTLNTK